jgi:hypothetical protein
VSNEDYKGNNDEVHEYLKTAIKKIVYEVVGREKREYRMAEE